VRPGASLAALALAAAAAAPAAASPQVDYMLQCQGCHLADGSGLPGSVPALRGSVGRFLAVPGGRAYLIRVPGSSQSPLSDAQLAAVLNWIVRRFGPADAAARLEPFSAEEVARHRRPPLADVQSVRRELLAHIQAGSGAAAASSSGSGAPKRERVP
jgi:mono/diheme cytochrome c family protein